jgi:hypothetical protein
MWIFSVYGFYSVACASKPDGALDPDTLMVRARCKDHLQNLQKRCPQLASSKILSPPNRDYGYRLIVPKSVWVAALQEMVEEQSGTTSRMRLLSAWGGTEPSTPTHSMKCGGLCTVCRSLKHGRDGRRIDGNAIRDPVKTIG